MLTYADLCLCRYKSKSEHVALAARMASRGAAYRVGSRVVHVRLGMRYIYMYVCERRKLCRYALYLYVGCFRLSHTLRGCY
jgi:hypothetical protein